jgi:hypothetical protein
MAVPLIVLVRTASGVAMQTCGIVHWHEVDVLRGIGGTRMGQSCSCSVFGHPFHVTASGRVNDVHNDIALAPLAVGHSLP